MSETFTTVAGTTVEVLREYEPQAKQASETKCRVLLRMASNAVASLAPSPAEGDVAYTEARSDCELTLASHGLRTDWNELSSKDAGDLSKSINNDADVQAIIRQTMGKYVTPAPARRIRSAPSARG